MKISATCIGIFVSLLASLSSLAQVTTSQYDNFRTGATLSEKILTPQNVNAKQFGKLGAFKVDGAVYAQPLFVPGVEVPGKGMHDVIYVATEHDSVYAFDAYSPGEPPLWQVSFLDKSRNLIVPSEDDVQCPFIRPEVGITSTPVIDIKTGTLYVLTRTKIRHTASADEYFQHLHALAITTGVVNRLHDLVRRCPVRTTKRSRIPSADELCRAMDLACVLYPKRVMCLQRSVATTLLLRRYGIGAEMVIGAQMLPLKSHAWVELNGKVINDKPYMLEIYRPLERC